MNETKKEASSTLKRLGDNFISLVILQIINYVLPLLLIPYLIRVLGIDGFGIYSFILAIIMYGVRMSDYGFELSGTYHISLHREDKAKKNEIFSSILIIKLAIAFMYLLVLTLLIFWIDKLYIHKEMLFISFGLIFGYLFFPVWFFQGMEKMRYIMLLNSFSKFLFIISVFIFVEEKSDLLLLLFLGMVSTLMTGVIALFMAIKNFNIELSWQPWKRLEFYLKDGWYIFTSKIAVEFYSSVNIIILGFFATPLVVGYYAVAVKIIHAMGSLLDPLTRTVYPYLVNVYHQSSESFINRNKQLSVVIFLVMLPISILVMYFSEWILSIVTGELVSALSLNVLEVFSMVLVVYLYGSQFTNMLVTIKETKFLNKVLFMAAGINTLLAPICIHFYGVIGLVWLNVFVGFFVTITKGYHLFIRLKV